VTEPEVAVEIARVDVLFAVLGDVRVLRVDAGRIERHETYPGDQGCAEEQENPTHERRTDAVPHESATQVRLLGIEGKERLRRPARVEQHGAAAVAGGTPQRAKAVSVELAFLALLAATICLAAMPLDFRRLAEAGSA
jgi:hypothetical protein